jgi:arginine repressor
MANAVAVCIDGLDLSGIVGTVAGDDTILIVITDNDTAVDVHSALVTAFEK